MTATLDAGTPRTPPRPSMPTPVATRRARRLPVAMIAATLAMLIAAALLQLAVYGHGGATALSDIPRVLIHRGIGPRNLPYLDRPLEYPVGSGILLYLATVIAPGPFGTLAVTAIAAGAVCVGITVALERRCGRRAWRWVLATPVLLFVYQNWDLFAIAALLGAVVAAERHRDRVAGVLCGVGAAVKLFPAVLVLPLVASRVSQGDRRGALRIALSATAAFAVINLPVLVATPTGWWWPFAFQGGRVATWGTAWFYAFRVVGLPDHGAAAVQLANAVSFVALGAGMVWLTARAARARLSVVSIAAAGVVVFLLAAKVYSPTYDVWLVPFFVLLPVSRRLWLAFCAVDLGVFLTVYGYFHGAGSLGVVLAVLPVLVVIRVVVLVRLLQLAVRHPELASWHAPTPVPHVTRAEGRALATRTM
jgi:uncharacterized membrane protein